MIYLIAYPSQNQMHVAGCPALLAVVLKFVGGGFFDVRRLEALAQNMTWIVTVEAS